MIHYSSNGNISGADHTYFENSASSVNARQAKTAFTANRRSGSSKRLNRHRKPASASASAPTTAAHSPPPAWEPEPFLETEESAAARAIKEMESRPWSKEDERALRGRIRDTMAKIEDISGGLQQPGPSGEGGGHGGPGAGRGGGNGSGSSAAGASRSRKNNQTRAASNQPEIDGSIKHLHESLQISLELVATGEKHASANTTTIADMSEWLSNLEQKQLVSFRHAGIHINN